MRLSNVCQDLRLEISLMKCSNYYPPYKMMKSTDRVIFILSVKSSLHINLFEATRNVCISYNTSGNYIENISRWKRKIILIPWVIKNIEIVNNNFKRILNFKFNDFNFGCRFLLFSFSCNSRKSCLAQLRINPSISRVNTRVTRHPREIIQV